MISTFLICFCYLFFALTGLTLIKIGHGQNPLFMIPLLNVGISAKFIIGIFFYGLSFLTFVFFVSKLKVSVAIPVISGINGILTVVVGMLIFNEKIATGQIIGIGLVILGTVIVGICK